MANRISQPHVDSERFAFAQAATSSARLWSNGPLVLTKSSAGELLVNDAIIEGRYSGRAIFRLDMASSSERDRLVNMKKSLVVGSEQVGKQRNRAKVDTSILDD